MAPLKKKAKTVKKKAAVKKKTAKAVSPKKKAASKAPLKKAAARKTVRKKAAEKKVVAPVRVKPPAPISRKKLSNKILTAEGWRRLMAGAKN